jgi:hypothetical protein
VIRRESAYLIEERIKVVVDSRRKLSDSLVDRVSGCQGPASDSPLFTEYMDAAWPESQSLVSVLPKGATHGVSSTWHDIGSCARLVEIGSQDAYGQRGDANYDSGQAIESRGKGARRKFVPASE